MRGRTPQDDAMRAQPNFNKSCLYKNTIYRYPRVPQNLTKQAVGEHFVLFLIMINASAAEIASGFARRGYALRCLGKSTLNAIWIIAKGAGFALKNVRRER